MQMYLFNIGPEVVNPTGDGAGDVPQPHLLLPLLTLLHLLLFNMVTCTCAHKLQRERLLNLKLKLNFSLLHTECSLGLEHVVKYIEVTLDRYIGCTYNHIFTSNVHIISLQYHRLSVSLLTFLAAAIFQRLSWAKSAAIHCISSSR